MVEKFEGILIDVGSSRILRPMWGIKLKHCTTESLGTTAGHETYYIKLDLRDLDEFIDTISKIENLPRQVIEDAIEEKGLIDLVYLDDELYGRKS